MTCGDESGRVLRLLAVVVMDSGCVSLLVPTQLQGHQEAFLRGTFASSANAEQNRTAYVIVVTRTGACCDGSVGCISNEPNTRPGLHTSSVWVTLRTHSHISLTSVEILGQCVPLSEVNLVFYDLNEICQSELISRKYPYLKEKDHANDVVPYFIHCVQRDATDHHCQRRREPLLLLLWTVIRLFLAVSWMPKILFEALHSFLRNRLDYSSSFLQQILLRISQIKKIQDDARAGKSSLLCGRLLTMIAIDVLAGVCVACVISSYVSVGDMYSSFCSWTKLLAATVHRLLDWLSGAPAGLKLNQPLTQALSAFFSYHVHLWILYLELADPVLRGVAWVLVWLGMCGVSVQVAILSDLLDLATLHLHCFYIYGARLYNLQTSLLGSQWRAFRGRKWNPLKQRVDTYDAGGAISLRRVLTAVVFTLVVFLLPTITIYYLVFVLLRVSLKLARGLLAGIVWVLNINPLYLVLLNMTGSNRVKGDIYFSTLTDQQQGEAVVGNCEGPLLLSLCTWPSSLSHILTDASPNTFPSRPSPNWSFIVSSIMFGERLL